MRCGAREGVADSWDAGNDDATPGRRMCRGTRRICRVLPPGCANDALPVVSTSYGTAGMRERCASWRRHILRPSIDCRSGLLVANGAGGESVARGGNREPCGRASSIDAAADQAHDARNAATRQAGLVARRIGGQPPPTRFFSVRHHGSPFYGRALWGSFGCAGSNSRSTNPQGRALPFGSGWRETQSV